VTDGITKTTPTLSLGVKGGSRYVYSVDHDKVCQNDDRITTNQDTISFVIGNFKETLAILFYVVNCWNCWSILRKEKIIWLIWMK
jgi:hypothetical protein